MRHVIALGVAALAAVAVEVSGRAPRAADAGTLTVMTFNIQHGIDGSHKYNLQRAIDTIAKVAPDIVGLQEVTRNHPFYNCDDQPARIAAGLEAATGRKWSVVYEQEWFTPNVECQQSGRGDGKETEGLALLAPGPLGKTSSTPLPNGRIGLAAKLPSAGGVPIVVTHLASGAANASWRQKQVAALLAWARGLGAPQILMGDFNATPDDPVLQPIRDSYRDAWMLASGTGAASGDGATHGAQRIDLVFVRGDALAVDAIRPVDTRSWLGTEASDHRPVVAIFSRRRPS